MITQYNEILLEKYNFMDNKLSSIHDSDGVAQYHIELIEIMKKEHELVITMNNQEKQYVTLLNKMFIKQEEIELGLNKCVYNSTRLSPELNSRHTNFIINAELMRLLHEYDSMNILINKLMEPVSDENPLETKTNYIQNLYNELITMPDTYNVIDKLLDPSSSRPARRVPRFNRSNPSGYYTRIADRSHLSRLSSMYTSGATSGVTSGATNNVANNQSVGGGFSFSNLTPAPAPSGAGFNWGAPAPVPAPAPAPSGAGFN